MQQQSHNINFSTPASDPTITTTTPTTDKNFIDVPPPTITDTILPHPHPAPITATTCRTPTSSVATCDYLLPPTPPPPQYQRWGLGTNLSSMRSHIYLTHRPGRSLANPSHRAWSTNTNQRPPLSMPSMLPRIQSSHAPVGHMRIHVSGIHRFANKSCAPINTSRSPITSSTTSTSSRTPDSATPNLPCPHCYRTFSSRIDLAGHLQIHRTDTGEPMPGAPTYTRTAHAHSYSAWAY
ncbi:unnamed protein product [Schistocephalus solidus]|uniref:C2H2-type domain-containing protein n=1 Tax=Schistocephalus solidus TaxID=70667 RepID=A0A183TBB3_SCHSO|nr:unnamed protein product [Schistocephalus solidus]